MVFGLTHDMFSLSFVLHLDLASTSLRLGLNLPHLLYHISSTYMAENTKAEVINIDHDNHITWLIILRARSLLFTAQTKSIMHHSVFQQHVTRHRPACTHLYGRELGTGRLARPSSLRQECP